MTGYDLAVSTMNGPASVSVRLNPFKRTGALPDGTRVPWCDYGYVLESRPCFTLDPLFHAGSYYVQDSSAMFVGWLFRRLVGEGEGSGLRVLDLCAAPGGKTTDLAASLRERSGDDFLLVANEVMQQRARILSENVAVWGDPNIVVTSVDPKAFASLGGFFDVILADVPCSGEGMFRKDKKAFDEWSEDVVSLCESRQRRILADVWPALKEGGILIYSTCTFEDRENDGNLAWAAETLGGELLTASGEAPFEGIRKTSRGYLLVTGEVPGEGQYAGALRKTAAAPAHSGIAGLDSLHPLRSGVSKGVMKGKDFVPDPDYALSLAFDDAAYPAVDVDRSTALSFLHRDAIVLKDAPLGYVVLRYEGLPLGFVKNLGRRCNNLHPQGRRILMDINKQDG